MMPPSFGYYFIDALSNTNAMLCAVNFTWNAELHRCSGLHCALHIFIFAANRRRQQRRAEI
jgi:hypothetical protein